MSKINFINLHCHSTYSTFDAIGYPNEYIDSAIENGMSSIALTDHGNMSALPHQIFYSKKLKSEGKIFKPIFGIESYFIPSVSDWKILKQSLSENKKQKAKEEDEYAGTVVEDEVESKRKKINPLNKRSHLVLLAQNKKGLSNLFKLVSESFKPGNFYKFPRMDYELLEKYNEGIIALSACLGGKLAGDYFDNKENGIDACLQAMRVTTERMMHIFDNGRWFGELQWNAIPEQHEVNQLIIQLSKEYDFKLVSTADCHYPKQHLWKDRMLYKYLRPNTHSKNAFLAKNAEIKTLPTSVDEIGYELYPKNGNQMMDAYEKYSSFVGAKYDTDVVLESILNTHEIVFGMVEDFSLDMEVQLPDFVVPKGKSDNEALREKTYEGFNRINFVSEEQKELYKKRIETELGVVEDRKFSRYFLTMKAIADKSNAIQLTGTGRGSAAGSLVSYLLNITQVDPIRWNLMFERFLRSDSTDYPDIDTDHASNEKIKQALVEMWGEDNVVSISNWNTLQLKSLIKDISKFYNIPFQEVNLVTIAMMKEATPKAKAIKGMSAGVYTPTFDEVMEHSKTLQNFLQQYPTVKTHVHNLMNQIRSCSRHAAGVLISSNLPSRMPLIYSGGVRQSPWSEGQNIRHLEPLGFIKFDILGLGTLRMFENAIKQVLKKENNQEPSFDDIKNFYITKLHPDVIDFDDQKVYKNVFHKGKWCGVFQFDSSSGMQSFTKKVKPKNLEELSILNATWRPAILEAKVHTKFLETRKNPEKVFYENDIFKEVLSSTNGFLIYQEQLATLAHKLGKDISLNDANLLRKVLTKKGTGKETEVKNKFHDKFIEGCIEKEISNESAEKWWQDMVAFNGYAFNKCIHGSSLVETREGKKEIKDVKIGEEVNSINGFVKIKSVYQNGKKKLYKIKTASGKTLTCTFDHKLQTCEGMKTLEEIISRKLKVVVKN